MSHQYQCFPEIYLENQNSAWLVQIHGDKIDKQVQANTNIWDQGDKEAHLDICFLIAGVGGGHPISCLHLCLNDLGYLNRIFMYENYIYVYMIF